MRVTTGCTPLSRTLPVLTHLFVHTLYTHVGRENSEQPLARLLPPDPTQIYPAEANEFSAIVCRELRYRSSCHGNIVSCSLTIIFVVIEVSLTTCILTIIVVIEVY